MKWSCITLMVVGLGLAACSQDRNVTLTKFRKTGNGPDAFSVVPGKPLQAPENYTDLPPPTPGMSNRADQRPQADVIAALGGNAATLNTAGIPANDASLVNYAGRQGIELGIRQTLAQEDADLRRRRGKVNIIGLGYTDNYTAAYKPQWLDADAEQWRLQQLGVQTPTAPPPD